MFPGVPTNAVSRRDGEDRYLSPASSFLVLLWSRPRSPIIKAALASGLHRGFPAPRHWPPDG